LVGSFGPPLWSDLEPSFEGHNVRDWRCGCGCELIPVSDKFQTLLVRDVVAVTGTTIILAALS